MYIVAEILQRIRGIGFPESIVEGRKMMLRTATQEGCEIAEILKPNVDRTTLSKALTQLPNISKVIILPAQIALPNWTGQTLLTTPSMSIEELHTLLDNYHIDSISNFGTTFGIPIDDLVSKISLRKEASRLATRQFASALEASVAAGIRLQTLYGEVDSDYFDGQLVRSPYWWMNEITSETLLRNLWINPYNKHLETAFRNLEDLELCVLYKRPVNEKQYIVLGQAIQSARGLKSLNLMFEVHSPPLNDTVRHIVKLEALVGKFEPDERSRDGLETNIQGGRG